MIENFTVSPTCENSECSRQPTDVVFIPTGVDLALGFQCARPMLQQHHFVRIVGDGVTLSENWPSWITTEPNVLLTELGAYQPKDVAEEFLPLRANIDRWLDITFSDVLPDFRGSRIFYGAAVIRLIRPIIEAFSVLAIMTLCSGAVRYHCADEQWCGLELLQYFAEQNGGTLLASALPKSVFWPLEVLTFGLAAFTGVFLDQLHAYLKEAPSRARLRRLRSHASGTPPPHFWVLLVPDWIRLNRAVLEGVVKPVLQSGERLGVLLSGTLQAGARKESNMRARTGRELWPGLGLLQHRIEECSVDQVVSPQSPREFLIVCAQALKQSIRVLLRLAGRPSHICLGSLHFDLAKRKWQLAKLATKDVWSAIAAEKASRAAIQRCSFAGAKVISVGAITSELAVADMILQCAGATTVDFAHGAAGCWLSTCPSVSSIKCVWTRPDAASVAPFGQPTIVAGTPRTVAKNYRPPAYKARNILITSNYVHRDRQTFAANGARAARGIGASFPEFAFQEELLTVIRVIRENFGQRFNFRWRPHPADIEEAVMVTLKRYPRVDLSRGHPLEEDVAWADLIITSRSSTIAEFLLAEIPIFLHVTPSVQHAPDVACFDAERKFVRVRDLQWSFAQCIATMDAGDQSYLEPERRARVAFFGPAGEPVSLFNLLTDEKELFLNIEYDTLCQPRLTE